ncbi:MAG: terminase large subunit [Bacteroidales bacterium]|nr:terminase large subunit [Bacteroidales bacterium]
MNNEAENIKEYVDKCWHKVEEYIYGVRDGSIIVNQYMKNVVEWFAHPGDEYEIKVKKVDRVFRFLYLVNIAYGGEGYKRLELLPWQALLIAMIFGIYHKGTNRRRFSESFTYMGRGNGKTTLGVALALYFLLGYKQISPQAIIISTVLSRENVISNLTNTIMHSPELYQYIHFNKDTIMLNTDGSSIRRGKNNRTIKTINDTGSIKVVPNDSAKIDGPELALAFIDEIHLLKDEKVYRSAQKSADKRPGSLVMLISTAGYSTMGFCVDLVDRAKKIAMGEIKEDGFLPFLYCLDKDDDVEDISNKKLWYKCNPSLGHNKTLYNMEKNYGKALFSPSAKADFKTKDLNIFINYNEYEVLSDADKERAFKPVDLEKWYGKDCYLGLDLSKTNDLSSLVCLFHDDENDKWEAYPYYWIANDSKLFIRKTGENILDWVNQGYITRCSGKYIDNGLIAQRIDILSKQFNVIGIGYDPYGWAELQKFLIDVECGEQYPVKQWPAYMSEPLSKILTSIYSDKLIYSDNPVMIWNWRNIRIRYADSNGNLKIFKNESKESVDGAVALNDAMALYYHRNYDKLSDVPIW